MLTFPLVIYSKSAEYAIQAMIYLTENVSDKPTMIHKIAKEYNIPYHFLAKIMQTLVKHQGCPSTVTTSVESLVALKGEKKELLKSWEILP